MNEHLLKTEDYERVVNRKVKRYRWRERWPLGVWLLAVVAAIVLCQASPNADSTFVVQGIVESDAIAVAPVETARISSIRVVEGQQVKKGDLLVEMDDSLIVHGVSSDIIDMIQIGTSFGDTHQDVLQAVSQRLDAISAIETEMAICRQDWQREQAELAALQAEQTRRNKGRSDGMIDEITRTELLPGIANLEHAILEYPKRMQTLQRQLTDAQIYHRNIMNWLGAKDGEGISAAIQERLNESHVKELLATAESQAKQYHDAYTIRASHDGVVSAIFLRAGDVGVAGVPILRIVPETPRRVTGYLTEAQAAGLREGMRVAVRPAARKMGTEAYAVLESSSPEIHITSYTLSPTGRPIPLRAQRAFFRIDGPHELIGGEFVYLRDQEIAPGLRGMIQKLGLHI